MIRPRAFPLFLALVLAFSVTAQDRVISFPDVPGYETLVVDLHIHSVFSDGDVWPSVRVREAVRDGLDLLAVTEHLEYQPHSDDIPHPDRNRSYELSARVVEPSELLIVNGAEITQDMPPGHINTVFIEDANALLVDDPWAAITEANRQGGFVFWNHPSWSGQRSSGVAEITDMHRQLMADGMLHGIEVANGRIYSGEAFQFALDTGLTILGVSDIHGLIDWDYDFAAGEQRTSTLVFADERSPDAALEALRAGRTVAWMDNTLIGREEHVAPLLAASLEVERVEWCGSTALLEVELANRSGVAFELANASGVAIYDRPGLVRIAPHGDTQIELAGVTTASVDLRFEVLNALVGPGQHAVISLPISVPERDPDSDGWCPL